ncbi:orotate phosphoribosyltransferase [Nafulsella turpanensis]|uniref:orotate phosphoribosyltransferase n=1 Tax=Nafulsella turpanensis TaxID=1265690 RepID=UPI00034DEC0D|nr:orotate phosphoribosyltransferase [Nafulsella turpanensis]
MSIADNTTQIARDIATKLLEIGAIKLSPEQPFQWSSGWHSPIYCDNRLALSYPDIRNFIKRGLSSLISQHFPAAESIAGVATAGIPQGALVADALQLPFAYVRSKPKGHGMENLIEGHLPAGRKVVVVEDLVSTGGSSLKAAEALRSAGCEVLGMASIFTYGFELAKENFAAAQLPLYSLSNYNILIEEAEKLGLVTAGEIGSLEAWRKAPESWKGR